MAVAILWMELVVSARQDGALVSSVWCPKSGFQDLGQPLQLSALAMDRGEVVATAAEDAIGIIAHLHARVPDYA